MRLETGLGFLLFVLSGLSGSFLGSLLCSWGKLEADFGGFGVKGEVGGEGAFGFLGNEAGKEGCFSFDEHFLDVGCGKLFLKDRFAEAEAVGVVLGGERGDHEGFFRFVEFGRLAVGEGDLFDHLIFSEVLDGFEIGVEDEVGLPLAELAGFGNLLFEFEGCFERSIEAGHETVAGFEEFCGEKRLGFFFADCATGDVFGNSESAIWSAAFVSGVGLFELGGTAVRAGALEVWERTRDDFVVVRTGFADCVFGEARDLAHEGGSVEFALFHLSELGFPVSGHRGRSERLDVHFLEEINEAHTFAGGDELASVTDDVFLANETFDGRGTGSGCAESAFGHCFAELVVVDELSGSFHRGEESRFGVAGGRIGFLFLHRNLDGLGVFAFLNGAELVFARGDAGFATVDGEPAGSDENLTVGAEGVLFGTVIDGSEAFGDLELGMREEDGEEALHDHVVELGNGLVDFDNTAGRDDCEVIGDFRVIKDALLKLQAVVVEGILGPVGEIGSRTGEISDDLLHVGHVVLGEVARVGPGIGDHLVPLIKSLGEPEGILGGKGSLTLQGREVVKLGRDLLGGIFVLGDNTGLALATLGDDTGTFFIPDAFGATVGIAFVLLEVEVDPLTGILTGIHSEESVDFGVRSGGEGCDFLFALREDGESGRLDASGGSDIKATVAGTEAG